MRYEDKTSILRVMVGNGLLRNDVRAISCEEVDFLDVDLALVNNWARKKRTIKRATYYVQRIRNKWSFSNKNEIRRCLPMVLGAMLATGNRQSYDYGDLPEPHNSYNGKRELEIWILDNLDVLDMLYEEYDRVKW